MLNQTLIPLTMFTGWLFLGKRSGGKEMLGASIIFGGAFVVLLPQLLGPGDEDVHEAALSHTHKHMHMHTQLYREEEEEVQHGREGVNKTHLLKASSGVLFACFLYACSNVPKAMAGVYKELGMGDMKVNVIYLTQWVSVYQLLWGLCLMPVQSIPGFGSEDGMTMQESYAVSTRVLPS